MKVLVESGATKSEWRVIGTGEKFFLPGTNVSSMRIDDVKTVIAEGLGRFSETPQGFYLYTAGVVTSEIFSLLRDFIRGISPVADIDIQDDLVGAARGVLGLGSGVVAIMGTGSNACFYDGKSISRSVYSGGFILGDEGSASVLGKLFVADWLKNLVPQEIAREFESRFDITYASIVENVYRGTAPSRYLGSFAPFIMGYYDSSPYVRALVDGHFRAFARKSLKAYDVDHYPVGVVGGFGYACREIVSRVFAEEGIRVERFIKAPIDGLEEFHL